jgi:hypothetical protein
MCIIPLMPLEPPSTLPKRQHRAVQGRLRDSAQCPVDGRSGQPGPGQWVGHRGGRVGGAGLQQEHTHARIRGQPGREHTACGAAASDLHRPAQEVLGRSEIAAGQSIAPSMSRSPPDL